MAELAGAERAALVEQLAACERELLLQLLPKDEVDLRGIVLEVRQKTLCLQKGPFTPLSSLLSAPFTEFNCYFLERANGEDLHQECRLEI